MSDKPSRCGQHTTISGNDAVRVTQCACGTYHIHLNKKGLSFQVGLDDLQRMSDALGLAVRVADAENRCATLPGDANLRLPAGPGQAPRSDQRGEAAKAAWIRPTCE